MTECSLAVPFRRSLFARLLACWLGLASNMQRFCSAMFTTKSPSCVASLPADLYSLHEAKCHADREQRRHPRTTALALPFPKRKITRNL